LQHNELQSDDSVKYMQT